LRHALDIANDPAKRKRAKAGNLFFYLLISEGEEQSTCNFRFFQEPRETTKPTNIPISKFLSEFQRGGVTE